MRIEYDGSNDTIKIFDDGTEIFPASTGVSNTVGLSGHNSLHFGCAPYASGTVITATFSPLSGTPTTDFKELTAANLPDPTIADPSAHFQTTLYSGNSSTQEINQSGNSTFTPGWVWIKPRNGTGYSHQLFDQVRGATKRMQSDAASVEDTNATTLTSFDSDGFSLGSHVSVNETGKNMVAWQWKANGSGSSNTDGSITSTVSANPTAGFSIVKYTGNATVGATVGHGLGAVPKMFVVKPMDAVEGWAVYNASVGNTKGMYLNLTDLPYTGDYYWNNTTPTSSVFTLDDHVLNNGSGNNMISYCFAEVEGFSKISSFEGNSNADGTFVYTGFKPAFILTKNIDTTDQWGIRDSVRNPFNVTDKLLNPNASTAETTSSTGYIDILSNGFKARSSDSNINTQTIIYMAFAESPFKTATAR